MTTKVNEAVVQHDVWLARARGVRIENLRRLTFDPIEARRACVVGLTTLHASLDTLKKGHPGFDVKWLMGLPELCTRVSDLQHVIDEKRQREGASESTLVADARAWRKKLMPLAGACVAMGRIEAKEVARIRGGTRTRLGLLRDVQDLVKLLTGHDEMVDATCGENALERAGIAAQRAIDVLGLTVDAEMREAIELRDRFATLLFEGHDRLRAAVAAVSSYRRADTLVPPLRTHRSRKPTELVDPVISPEPAPG